MVERTLISLPSQLQLIERLQHLIYLSSSLIFVSGEAGAGKSTLTENLSNELPDDVQQVYISLTQSSSLEKLRQQIVSQLFENALFNAEDKLPATIQRLQKDIASASNTLIIIDNANYLPPTFVLEVYELLENIGCLPENNFNVLLLSDELNNQTHLNAIAHHFASGEQANINHVELKIPGLSIREANTLLIHNFQQSEYKAELQHQDALNQQLKSCNGNPQKIIKLADDLSHGMLQYENSSWIKTRLPAVLLMLFLMMIVSLLAIYLYPKFTPTNVNNLTAAKTTKTTPLDATAITENEEVMAGSWKINNEEIKDNNKQVGLSDAELRVADQQLSPESLSDVSTVSSQAQSTEPEQQPLLQIKQESYDEAPLRVIDNHSIQKEPESIAPKSSPLDIVPDPNPSVSDHLTEEKSLLMKNANDFTVQLSGMASKKTLASFITKHNLPQKDVFIYQTIRKDKAWFVVIYGDYSSLKQAKSAVKSLPATFKGMPTWIKKWQAVHNDLRLNNE